MIRFSDINRINSLDYKPNYQRHHLIPRQTATDSNLRKIFEFMADDGFDLEDFEQNGILLPSCEKEAIRTGRPLHRGPHPRYNEIVMQHMFRISKLGDRIDDVLERQNFIGFRLSLLQSSLRSGLNAKRFKNIYLSSRDPLRSGLKFDRMDTRIEQLDRNVGQTIADRVLFKICNSSTRKS